MEQAFGIAVKITGRMSVSLQVWEAVPESVLGPVFCECVPWKAVGTWIHATCPHGKFQLSFWLSALSKTISGYCGHLVDRTSSYEVSVPLGICLSASEIKQVNQIFKSHWYSQMDGGETKCENRCWTNTHLLQFHRNFFLKIPWHHFKERQDNTGGYYKNNQFCPWDLKD